MLAHTVPREQLEHSDWSKQPVGLKHVSFAPHGRQVKPMANVPPGGELLPYTSPFVDE
jgi:hypothetical protein